MARPLRGERVSKGEITHRATASSSWALPRNEPRVCMCHATAAHRKQRTSTSLQLLEPTFLCSLPKSDAYDSHDQALLVRLKVEGPRAPQLAAPAPRALADG